MCITETVFNATCVCCTICVKNFISHLHSTSKGIVDTFLTQNTDGMLLKAGAEEVSVIEVPHNSDSVIEVPHNSDSVIEVPHNSDSVIEVPHNSDQLLRYHTIVISY